MKNIKIDSSYFTHYYTLLLVEENEGQVILYTDRSKLHLRIENAKIIEVKIIIKPTMNYREENEILHNKTFIPDEDFIENLKTKLWIYKMIQESALETQLKYVKDASYLDNIIGNNG